MSVVWIPVVLICTINIPHSECVVTNPTVTVIRGQKQNTQSDCLHAAMATYAAYANAPALGEPFTTKLRCEEKHLND